MVRRSGQKTNKKGRVKIAGILISAVFGLFAGFLAAFMLYLNVLDKLEGSVYREINIEYGHQITLSDFFDVVPEDAKLLSDVSVIDTGVLGTYRVAIEVAGRKVYSNINIIDKRAPVAKAIPQEMYLKDAVPDASSVIRDLFDLSDVNVEYEGGGLEFKSGGNFDVPVKLTDKFGNASVVIVPFTVKDDRQAPQIEGAHDLTVLIGDSISYRDGITVTDNYDPNPKLTIDNSEVNLKLAGVYPLTFIAVDECGNENKVTVQVEVVTRRTAGITGEDDEETVKKAYELASEIVKSIVKEDATDVEKAMAIFYWSYHRLGFARGTSDYTSWAHAAVKAFTRRVSSCYGHWAVCKAMLDVCGIKNICVTRSNSSQVHYWCLVYLNGGWYHCDSQAWAPIDGYFAFMLTDEELITRARGNHDFDKKLYPARATESVQRYVSSTRKWISPDFPYKNETN